MTDLPSREDALRAELAELQDHLAALQSGHEELRQWLANLQPQTDALSERVGRVEPFVAGDTPLQSAGAIELEQFDAGLGGRVVGFRGRGRVAAGADLYRGFEDFFRGSEEMIALRQTAYLPLLLDRAPVLDVGCGRGELLGLLRDAGVPARGLDLDPGMVRRCREKGLEATTADALTHLAEVDDDSLGAVVLIQVIEHLPYAELVALLDAATAKLRPGGRLIMETLNPHCPQALKNFWIDPTHQHPLYPEVVIALCGLAGFDQAFIWHASGTGDPDRDRLREIDYAVVAQTEA